MSIQEGKKNIFIAALDWGWGHVTRSIALVEQLEKEGHHIILGGSGDSGAYFKDHFPKYTYYELPRYAFTFDDTKNVYWQMMRKIPEVTNVMKEEAALLSEINQKENLDVIISDHRYGLRLAGKQNVILCHQLNLQAGNYSRIVNALHHSLLLKFDAIWVPDHEENSLSGKLSHVTMKLEDKVKFIGSLSTVIPNSNVEKDIEYLVVFTGPEPQRTRFEESLSKILNTIEIKGTVIQGAASSDVEWKNHFDCIQVASRSELSEYIQRAKKIITRSGYSSIMDLHALGTPVLMVPTLGQTEQEYLGQHLLHRDQFTVIDQKDLSKQNILAFLQGE